LVVVKIKIISSRRSAASATVGLYDRMSKMLLAATTTTAA
jgi:hypothetical protein